MRFAGPDLPSADVARKVGCVFDEKGERARNGLSLCFYEETGSGAGGADLERQLPEMGSVKHRDSGAEKVARIESLMAAPLQELLDMD